MTRPRGEARQALLSAFEARGCSTWRIAAEVSCVGYDTARRTVENMVRAGELVRVGADGPCGVYAPAARANVHALASEAEALLVAACASWAAFK